VARYLAALRARASPALREGDLSGLEYMAGVKEKLNLITAFNI